MALARASGVRPYPSRPARWAAENTYGQTTAGQRAARGNRTNAESPPSSAPITCWVGIATLNDDSQRRSPDIDAVPLVDGVRFSLHERQERFETIAAGAQHQH